jgi:hypothetical protein
VRLRRHLALVEVKERDHLGRWIPNAVRCGICNEAIATSELDNEWLAAAEHGLIAEMFPPGHPDHARIVHTTCGLAKGWWMR